MPIYKITYTEYHRVSKEYFEEFDTSSVEHWNDLKSRVQDLMDEEEYSLLPEIPPVDPEIWLEVYKKLSGAEYEQEALEDWITESKGGYEAEWLVSDHDGTIVLNDSML